tara:strand:- start:73 stop:510 length:438 start_codon:yes stop_codon:yes gene_type:complete
MRKILLYLLCFFISNCSGEILSSESSQVLEDSKKAWCINWSSESIEILNTLDIQDAKDGSGIRYYNDGPRVAYWFKSFETSANLVKSKESYEDSIVERLNKGENSDFLDAFDIFSERIQNSTNPYVFDLCNIWYDSTKGTNFLFD